ncbi:ComEA family DNA-binding protein [Larkinella sp. VNQ87]|uniref:ComEA family DNA-binding protein n=1 Tax=Larkinella sp. VNQ87 TaxID=3400921 RepID=UPI003BFEF8D8
MKRLIAVLRDYFGVSHQEARGMLALLAFTALLLLAPLAYRLWVPDAVPDTSAADKRQLDSLVALLETENPTDAERDEKPPGRYEPAIKAPSVERFAFDPNTLDPEGWQRLGAPRWLAERIIRYRSKGGRFRQKEDLLKIYDFSPDLYAELEPYIRLVDERQPYGSNKNYSERLSASELNPANPMATRKTAFTGERFSKSVVQPFDINTVDTTELIKLRGIGSKLAARIVKFRDGLGGFVSPEQYAEIFGLDSLAREELTKFGRIESPPKKIAVNTATVEELDRHVYVSKRQAEVIVNYRTQHGPYSSAESLRTIRILDAKTIEKLKPYLEF